MSDVERLKREADEQRLRAFTLISEAGRLIDDLKSCFDQIQKELSHSE